MASEIHDLFLQCRRPSTKHENYFAIYDELFAPYKGRDLTFVEIGERSVHLIPVLLRDAQFTTGNTDLEFEQPLVDRA